MPPDLRHMRRSRGRLTAKCTPWLTAALARRLKTSCSQLDRILDPANEQVSLASLVGTAHAVGKRVRLELEEAAGFVGCGAPVRAMA